MARTSERVEPATAPASGATPALIRWGAIIGGGVIGLSLLVLLATLWLALAFGAGLQAIENNLDWLLTISAVVAMFVAGLLAGWLSGVPGFAPGLFNGLTVWGVILTVSLLIGTPSVLQTMGAPTEATIGTMQGQALWAGFITLLVGAVAAAVGGGLGGVTTRPAFVYAAPQAAARGEPTHRGNGSKASRQGNGGRARTPAEHGEGVTLSEEEAAAEPAEPRAGTAERRAETAERRAETAEHRSDTRRSG